MVQVINACVGHSLLYIMESGWGTHKINRNEPTSLRLTRYVMPLDTACTALLALSAKATRFELPLAGECPVL